MRMCCFKAKFWPFLMLSMQGCEVCNAKGGLVHLFAVAALWSKPALVAGHTVVVVFVRDERLCPDGLLAAVARKAVLVPRRAIIL